MRLAQEADVGTLQAVELDAAKSYCHYAETAFCSSLAVRTEFEHTTARTNGIALVGELNEEIVGFLLAVPLDNRAHLLELAVKQTHQKHGFGRRLIAAFEEWASSSGYNETTLTTFRDVSWNAPFYTRLGYSVIDVTSDRRGLLALIMEECLAGFAQAPRVAMSKRIWLSDSVGVI